MARGIGIAVVLGLIVTSPDVAIAKASKASAVTTDAGARRYARYHDAVRHAAPDEPRYYARPVYYRPYPYGVPAPFVFGYGPHW